MTITLNLPAKDEAELSDIAAREGQTIDTLAHKVFTAWLARYHAPAADSPSPATEWSAEFRAKYNIPADMHPLTEEELRAMNPEDESEAISLGLDDSFAGRVTPLAEWSAKVRARHNLPERASEMTPEEVMLLP